MASTATNKQPLLVDRPLIDSVRITSQTVGSATTNTLFIQGGQAPSLLVDMDAALSDDTNNGGVVDAITITRNDFYRGADYVVSSGTSGNVISLRNGQIVFISDTGVVGTAPVSGYGYYTYTGTVVLSGVNTNLLYSGGTTTGFVFNGVAYGEQPEVTFAFYHTRNTTSPIAGSGDYRLLFAKRVPANTQRVDCSDVMPELAAPVVSAGNTTGLGEATPLRNRGIYLQRGDRIYVGVFPDAVNPSGYDPGAQITAQGGYF